MHRILKPIYRHARSLPFLWPQRVECNVCGWRGRRFRSNKWHYGILCPICYSQIRHRLLVAAWSHLDALAYDRIVRDKRILHFGPEPYITAILKHYTAQHFTADSLRDDVDLRLDISNMPTIAAGSCDLVIACDVLEHVEDDIAAIKELFRVVSPGGYAILTVPQKDNLEETFEDKSVITPKERERVFGQSDHLRIYGRSFPRWLEATGFKVTIVDEENFSSDLIKRHVLFPLKLSTQPLATNYRKVFFAHKP